MSNILFKNNNNDPSITQLVTSVASVNLNAGSSSNSTQTKILLCFDGGGIRGILSLQILEYISKELGFDLYKRADLVAGTSTGGLITMCKAIGMNNEALESLYIKVGNQIFSNLLDTIKNLIKDNTTGNTDKLEDILKDKFGKETKLNNFSPDKKLFVITSSKQRKTDQSYQMEILSNYSTDKREACKLTVWESLRATSAAPFFLKALKTDNKKFVDGGLMKNNPAKIAHNEGRSLFGTKCKFIIISIGTGLYEKAVGVGPFPEIKQHFKKEAFDLEQDAIDLFKTFKQSIGNSHLLHLENQEDFSYVENVFYARFDPIMARNIEFDDVEEKDIKEMKQIAKTFIETKGKELLGKLKQTVVAWNAAPTVKTESA